MNAYNQLHNDLEQGILDRQIQKESQGVITPMAATTAATTTATATASAMPNVSAIEQQPQHLTVQMEVQSPEVTVPSSSSSPSSPSSLTSHHRLATTESTIIDIPSTTATTTIATATATTTTLDTTIVSSPVSSISSSLSSSSSSSSSYDTDCSTASSTCCTRHGEQIYMERTIVLQQHQHHHHHHQHQHQHYQQQQHASRSMPSSASASSTSSSAATAIATAATTATATLPDASSTSACSIKSKSKYSYQKSWPIFILLISIVEISIFVYDQLTYKRRRVDIPTTLHIPTNSVFIYRPDRRLQIWRFISYMFLHANWFHLGFNVVIQLFYGVPLEVMHGSVRVCIIYLAGVFAGSLGTSVVDSDVYLVGASGGVYALLAAHLANLMLNYAQMKYAVAQLVSVIIFVFCDLGYAFYTQYLDVIEPNSAPPVSYIAHLTGALAGLTIGLLVLKNFEQRAYENVIWYLALGVYSAFTIFAIAFNLANTVTAQRMEEQGEVITQHLLHDLGVS